MTGGSPPKALSTSPSPESPADDQPSGRPLAPALVLALAALGLLFFQSWRIDYDYSIDFQAYWLAGQRLAQDRANELFTAGGGPADGTPLSLAPREFKNIPLVAVPFAAFSALPYDAAKRVMWWLNLLALTATAAVLGRWVLPPSWGAAGRRSALALAALAAMAPAHIALRHGQTTPQIALLMSLSLAAGLRGRERAAGLLLAPAALVKWPAWGPAALDAARLRARSVAAFAGGLSGAVLLSLAIFGPDLHREYLATVREHAGTVMTGHNNQSLAAVVTRAMDGGDVRDWTPRPMSRDGRSLTAALALAVVAGLFVNLWRSRGRPTIPRRRGAEFAAATAAGLLVLPVAWDHYMLLLAPGVAALAARSGPRSGSVLAVSYFLMATPTPSFLIDRAPDLGAAGMLILSHFALGASGVFLLAMAEIRR